MNAAEKVLIGVEGHCAQMKVSLISVIVFGSYVKGGADNASDVDMIFIVDNFTSDHHILKLRSYLYSLERTI